jgi:NAD(P)-dependent dehydrogenase (short-subunit alcohol dehydrogenase family)
MVDAAEEQYGRLDYAVNNAGVSGQGAFMDIAVEDFDRIAAINLRGVVLAMQVEIPAMLRCWGGAIVNVSSAAGLAGAPGMSLYAASKWGVIGLTKSLAIEYATRGIRLNAIAPGLTATEMLDGGTKEEREFLLMRTPMKRISEPVEIARSVIYLLALANATYTTGAVLPADGGSSADWTTKASEVEKLFATKKERFSRLDILVNNAALDDFIPLGGSRRSTFTVITTWMSWA